MLHFHKSNDANFSQTSSLRVKTIISIVCHITDENFNNNKIGLVVILSFIVGKFAFWGDYFQVNK